MTPSAHKTASKAAVSKPIAAIVIPFDDTEHLPADIEIQFLDGARMKVESISQIPSTLYPDVTVFRGRFGSPGEEFVIDITVANSVLDRISRRRGGDHV
jgi:hypothetical protein